jgi:hypothetical protein
MQRTLVHGFRLVLVAGMVGLGMGQDHAQARATHGARADTVVRAGQSTAQLVYEGRILPIVTDVYNSLNDLGTALNNQDLPGLTAVASQFSGEQVRLEAVRPVPQALQPAATQLDRGIRGLSQGSHKLVSAIRAGDNAASQQAGTILTSGLKEFGRTDSGSNARDEPSLGDSGAHTDHQRIAVTHGARG